MPMKAIAALIPGQPTQDGNRVPLTRLIPGQGQTGAAAFRAMDPFLLLDHFGPLVLSPDSDAGFPPHPHRGFQTLTYLIQGAFRHRDSTGGSGLLRPGGAQLMNAGSGIIHEEMPEPEHLETGGPIEGVQLWINLPKAHKGSAPGYRDLQPETMPWQDLPGGRLRVLAGTLGGITGPALTTAKIIYAHLLLERGATFQQAFPAEWTTAVVPLQGSLLIAGEGVPTDTVAVLGAGDSLRVSTETGASFMVLAGEPIGEPIAHYGPFVMNTQAEIEQAFMDYQCGAMGSLTHR